MNLEKYRKEVANLSINDQKLRDLYLRDLSLGKIQGPLTGYASLDKPWLKYHGEEEIQKNFEPMSIYQLMKKQNVGFEKNTAINYYGKKINYGEMLKQIDIVARSLVELGVKPGDIVMMSMPNTPEAEYLFYAINKIGAIVNSIDPRTSQEVIKNDIIESKAKYFFSIDVIAPKIEKMIDDTQLTKIISIPPTTSLPLALKVVSNLTANNRKKEDNNNVMTWNDFCNIGKKSTKNVEEVYIENSTAVIVHTGGSTGIPKGVCLTNENFNALIYQLLFNGMGFERNMKFLNILPPFIALGLDNAMHLAACIGLESIMIPTFEPEDFPGLVLKYKPNLLLCGPIHCKMMIENEKMKNADLSFLTICCSGGDKMPEEFQRKIQQFLKEHNAKANIWIGYGATETSAGNTCLKDNCFRYDSVGTAYLKNNLAIFDIEKDEEVIGYNQIGELRVSGPTVMNGYFKNEKETKNVIKSDENGIRWYCTGDLAHFDEDGQLYIDGRIKRIITRRGFKIYPSYIESLILTHPAVKDCAVVGVPDKEEINIPVANIVLKDDTDNEAIKEQVIDFIDKKIKDELPDYSVMAGYNFLTELPSTPIGKLDFKKLEELGIMENQNKKMQKKFKI